MQTVSRSELADMIGVSIPRLNGLVDDGVVIRVAVGKYDLAASVRNYCARLRGTASGRGGEEQILDLTKERARLAKEQADGAAIKNAAARGELIDAGEVERGWSNILRKLQARMLAVPSRVRQSEYFTAAQVQAIDRELRDALTELAGGD